MDQFLKQAEIRWIEGPETNRRPDFKPSEKIDPQKSKFDEKAFKHMKDFWSHSQTKKIMSGQSLNNADTVVLNVLS